MDKTTKYIAAVAGVVILIIIGLFLIFGRSSSKPKTDNSKTTNLAQYASRDSFVVYTVQGKVGGDDTHRSIRITVTPTERRIEILRGYENFVERSQTYDNTQAAYESFLAALDRAGFGRKQQAKFDSSKGVCPLGKRYYYELDNNGDKEIDTWGSSCSRAEGNFGGAINLVRTLFESQITDYNKQVTGVRLT